MSARNESHGSGANLCTETPPTRVRDGDDPARKDDCSDDTSNPPTYGVSRFLWEVDHRTLPEEGWIEELGERYRVWDDDGHEQADLSRWSP